MLNNKLFRFMANQLTGKNFWSLFVACFTAVVMMALRASLRDKIFKEAGSSAGKRYN